jgi:hypothetical protein
MPNFLLSVLGTIAVTVELHSFIFPAASGLNFRLRDDDDAVTLFNDDAQLCVQR